VQVLDGVRDPQLVGAHEKQGVVELGVSEQRELEQDAVLADGGRPLLRLDAAAADELLGVGAAVELCKAGQDAGRRRGVVPGPGRRVRGQAPHGGHQLVPVLVVDRPGTPEVPLEVGREQRLNPPLVDP
jgi:hypothetical protein